jgi:DNA/RNA-binding protein KIN17
MPKSDVGGHRAMANQQKSRGLGQLQYYCQMCQKQCRDADGMKCHMTSEGHLRQMQLFAENSGGMINDFSKDFQKGFLRILFHRHGTKRVEANKVYQEYIADKHHIHMNATAWASLTEFCKHIGKEGLAVVDETEHGWWVRFIDRDPRLLARQESELVQRKEELGDEERTRQRVRAQAQAAHAAAEHGRPSGDQDTCPVTHMADVKLHIGAVVKKRSLTTLLDGGTLADESPKKSCRTEAPLKTNTVRSSLDRLMQEDRLRDEVLRKKLESSAQSQPHATTASELAPTVNDDAWLHAGIYVRIMNKKVSGGSLYKKKGRVLKVIDSYVGEVEVDDGATVRIDQEELETVVPKAGKAVLYLLGAERGHRGTLLSIDQDAFSCTVRMDEGPQRGYELTGVEFEQISRI